MSKRTSVERNIYLTHGGRYLVRIRSKDETKIYGNFYELDDAREVRDNVERVLKKESAIDKAFKKLREINSTKKEDN
jgi:hypothetical protein